MEQEEVSILQFQHQKDIEMTIASDENDALPVTSQLYCNSICTFTKLGNDYLESKERSKSTKQLFRLIMFYLVVMAVEIVGGLKANSLAVITDAAHLLTDVAGFSVSLFSVWASGWEATSQQSFGFGRLEVLGALISVQLIWVISGILIYEAVSRIFHNTSEVKGGLMFAIAAFGFIINLIMVIWLGHDHSYHAFHDHNHDHDQEGEDSCAVNKGEETKLTLTSQTKRKILNINIQGAYLHVMTDLIQSVGVMVAGATIWAKPDWLLVDLICTLVSSAFVFYTTIPMLRDIFSILMERTPCDINVGRVEGGLKCVKGVRDVHDLHIWTITVGKLVLSCHVVVEPGASPAEILNRIREYCEKTYGIHHVTIQIE